MDDQAHQPSNTTEQSNPALEGLLKKEDWMATNDRPAVEIVHVLNIKEKLLEEQAREEALETFYASLAPSEDRPEGVTGPSRALQSAAIRI